MIVALDLSLKERISFGFSDKSAVGTKIDPRKWFLIPPSTQNTVKKAQKFNILRHYQNIASEFFSLASGGGALS